MMEVVPIFLNITFDDVGEIFAQNFSVVIVHEAETVAVVGGAEIIPYAIGNIVFLQNGDHIPHPVFTPCDGAMANRSEFTAPQDVIGMALDKSLGGFKIIAQEADVHAIVVQIGGSVSKQTVEIAISLDIVAGVRHFSVIVQMRLLQNALLMCEFMGRVAMESVYDVFIVIYVEMIETGRVVPINTADDENAFFVLCADSGDRFFRNVVPFIRGRVDDFIEKFENDILFCGKFILKHRPQGDEAILQLLILHKTLFL